MASKKILVTGVSGTGKTTVCRELENSDIKTIEVDETPRLSYWVNKKTKEKLIKKADFSEKFLSEYEWICDVELLPKLVDEIVGEPVVICGNAENILELIDFCDVTLLLHCCPETFLSRVAARDDNEYGQTEDARNFILSYYEDDNQKCLDAGAIAINAEQPIEKVVEDVMNHLN